MTGDSREIEKQRKEVMEIHLQVFSMSPCHIFQHGGHRRRLFSLELNFNIGATSDIQHFWAQLRRGSSMLCRT